MLLDEQIMDLERFSITKTSQNSSRVKSTGTGINYNISGQKKKPKVFNSKFRQLGEHDLCLKSITFLQSSAISLTVGNPIQINASPGIYQSEKSGQWAAYNVLAQLTKFRVEHFCIFFLARNVLYNVHVHSFDPCALLEINST